MVRALQSVSRSRVMKEDGKFGRGVEMAGGGWVTSARWKTFEVIQIWGKLTADSD